MFPVKILLPSYIYNDLKLIVATQFEPHLKNKDKLDCMIFIERKIKVMLSKYVIAKHIFDQSIDYKVITNDNYDITIGFDVFKVYGFTDKDEFINIDLADDNESFFIRFSNHFKQAQVLNKVKRQTIINFFDLEKEAKSSRIQVKDIQNL